jgi:hypothetical protein
MTTLTNDQIQTMTREIIARSWSDPAFKERLLKDTMGTLKAEGYPVTPGHTVRAVEDSAATSHLVLPVMPANLSDEDLDKVAGGFYFCCWF